MYDNKQFDSSWELCYYIWLSDMNIAFKYPSELHFAYEFNGKQHSYFPDFVVNDVPVELKGNQFFDDNGMLTLPYRYKDWSDEYYENMCNLNKMKFQCMKDNNVLILREKDLTECFEHIQSKYNVKHYMDFCRQFKKSK